MWITTWTHSREMPSCVTMYHALNVEIFQDHVMELVSCLLCGDGDWFAGMQVMLQAFSPMFKLLFILLSMHSFLVLPTCSYGTPWMKSL